MAKLTPSVLKQLEIELFNAFWEDPKWNREFDRQFDELLDGRSENAMTDDEWDVVDSSLTHAEKVTALNELRKAVVN
jgi:hypothetical protein